MSYRVSFAVMEWNHECNWEFYSYSDAVEKIEGLENSMLIIDRDGEMSWVVLMDESFECSDGSIEWIPIHPKLDGLMVFENGEWVKYDTEIQD